jgi:putative transposase
VHCVIPAGGWSPDHTHGVKSQNRFFLPRKVLSRVFRGKFAEGLKPAFQNGPLNFHGNLAPLAQPKTFAAWRRLLFRKDWVVYAKRPFGGPQYVLQYLGRYTHRVAISNHRRVSFTDGNVTFRWRDSAHNNEQKLMALPIDEFLRRFLWHLLPKGFVRIRNFGFLANRRRAVLLPLCFHSLGAPQEPRAEQDAFDSNDLWRCLCVVDRWWSSKGSRPQKSNFVLRHWSALQHDTALPSSNPSRAAAPFLPLRLSAGQISSFSVFNYAY